MSQCNANKFDERGCPPNERSATRAPVSPANQFTDNSNGAISINTNLPANMNKGSMGASGKGQDDDKNNPEIAALFQQRRVSYISQFFASLERLGREKWRVKVRLTSELLVPVIFAVVLLALTKAFNEQRAEENFVRYNADSTPFLNPLNYLAFACNNASMGSIAGLPECPETADCRGDESALPVKGLCVLEGYSWVEVTVAFMTYAMGSAVGVLNLDSIIMQQWAALKGFGDQLSVLPVLSAISALGFGTSTNTRYNSIVSSGKLYFAPKRTVPTELIDFLNSSSSFFQYVYGGVFDSVDEARAFLKTDNGMHWGLIVVNDIVDDFDVEIQLNSSALPDTATVVNVAFSGAFYYDTGDMYVASGFVFLQKVLYDFYINSKKESFEFVTGYSPLRNLPVVISMGVSRSTRKLFLELAAPAVGFMIVLSYLYPFSQMVKRLVLDKELRIREATCIMGLKSAPIYASFFIVNALQACLTTLVVTAILNGGVTETSDFFTLFLILLVFVLTTIPLAGLVAAFFSNARLASQMAPLIYFVMSIPVFALGFASKDATIGLSLLSPTALSALLAKVIDMESGDGFSIRSFQYQYLVPHPSLIMMMLVIDFVAYSVLTLYLDAVLPTQWGSPKHPLFFILTPYRKLRACCQKGKPYHPDSEALEDAHEVSCGSRNPNGVFDDDQYTQSKRQAVRLTELTKRFVRSGKKFVAVDHLSWAMNEREISVLLGPNGAGKSTTVNMITGMTKPDEGDCVVRGHSVLSDLNEARQVLGFCPQHNILWSNLTCREHLEFYGKIKGLRGAALEVAVTDMLQRVALDDKANCPSRALSGGQKRKLSVAIAFVGGNHVVILDEPTAGMDAAARRHTWQLLRSMTAYCTILLCTHYMDEADLLGDRIAVMGCGRLQCSGSSLYLKSRLGWGYTLRVDLRDERDVARVSAGVTQAVSSASLFSQNAREALFRIPKEDIAVMPAALRLLENSGMELGAQGFSISASTLEEVFLRVVADAEEQQNDSGAADHATPSAGDVHGAQATSTTSHATPTENSTSNNPIPLSASEKDAEACDSRSSLLQTVWSSETVSSRDALWRMQLKGVLLKRFCCALRDRKMQFFQVLCPVACILLAMLLQLVQFQNIAKLDISPSMYGTEVQTLLSQCSGLFGSAAELETTQPNVDKLIEPFLDTRDLSYYLLDTFRHHRLPRYTAMQCVDQKYVELIKDSVPDASMAALISGQVSSILYNTSSSHSIAVGLHQFYDFIARQASATAQAMGVAPEASASRTFKLTTQPLAQTDQEKSAGNSATVMLIGLIVVIPFTFLPSTPVAWVVKERECKARHIQRLCGMDSFAYWLGNFIFDFLSYCVTAALVIIIFLIFQRKEYIGKAVIGATILGFLCYGLSSTLYAYVLGFFFEEHTSAQLATMLVSFVSGFILVLVVFVLDLNSATESISGILRWVFRLLPCFSMGEFVLNLAVLRPSYVAYGASAWTMDVIGWPCLYMACEVPIFVMFTFAMESPLRPHLFQGVRSLARRALCCRRGPSAEEEEPLPTGPWEPTSPGLEMREPTSPLPPLSQFGRSATVFSTPNRDHPPRPTWDMTSPTYAAEGSNSLMNEYRGETSPARQRKAVVGHSRMCSRGYFYHNREKSVVAKDREGRLLRLTGEDSDVEDERAAVYHDERMGLHRDVARMVNLRKVYNNETVAVRSLTFGVMPKEVFAFLGTNGAGKSTALSILCQEQIATSGRAYAGGHDTALESVEAMRAVGYCPQFDATLDLLTVEEHLELYASIHGIVNRQRSTLIACLLEVCGLEQYRKVLSCDLSGGNRRKLSVAVTLVGAPQVVCLDEPSAGMDPVARRRLWNAIQTIADRCSVILTTHHLEEVEALADCVAIMSKGTLRCIGDLPHLKSKYGSGYEMCLRVMHGADKAESAAHATERGSTVETDPILVFVAENFPGTILNECFRGERYVFALPRDKTVLSRVFELLRRHQEALCITDYSVSQTSIEQVFLRFCAEEEGVLPTEDVPEPEALATPQSPIIARHHSRTTSYSYRPLGVPGGHSRTPSGFPSGSPHSRVVSREPSGFYNAAEDNQLERFKKGVSGRRRGYC